LADASNRARRTTQLQAMADSSSSVKRITQLQEISSSRQTHQFSQHKPIQLKGNNTGLPDNLKSGIENLSGMNMDHVRVHYNSSQPAQLNALAYAQGSDIHVAPGQEKHLPHEAWHVVQQAQGRVQPTTQMKTGVAVNDDPGLEHEADVMGERATQMKCDECIKEEKIQRKEAPNALPIQNRQITYQLKLDLESKGCYNDSNCGNRISSAKFCHNCEGGYVKWVGTNTKTDNSASACFDCKSLGKDESTAREKISSGFKSYFKMA